MLDAKALITKHEAKSVLVDTNLLVLLLVGGVNKRGISQFKRTQDFTTDDFDLLERLVAWFGRLFITPHVLAQVSDLADLSGKELHEIRRLFRALTEQMEEVYDPSRELVKDALFERLGLTDAALATVGARGILVLTTDVSLQLALQKRGADALNFNHVRQIDWGWS